MTSAFAMNGDCRLSCEFRLIRCATIPANPGMTSSLPAVHPDQQQSVLSSTLERQLFYVLAAVALLYAFFAGLRTVEDFDLGWQMATARWMVAHHQVPRFDVLSYTMAG